MSSSKYYLMFNDGDREAFNSWSELISSGLILEAEAVYRSPSLAAQAMIGAANFEDYTEQAAYIWADGRDLYDEIVPPMFERALEDEIIAWRNHYEDGDPRPDGEIDWQQDEREMYRAAAL